MTNDSPSGQLCLLEIPQRPTGNSIRPLEWWLHLPLVIPWAIPFINSPYNDALKQGNFIAL